MADTASASPVGPRYAPEDPTLPKPWKGLVDGTTGYLYFWNPETNITQYERPKASSGRGPSPAPAKSTSASISSSVQIHHSTQGHLRSSRNDDDVRHNGDINGRPKLAAIPVGKSHQLAMGKKRISKGKQKIEIKEICDKANRHVAFTKRRNGVYKKVSEINTLCGAESGVLVFSPAGRAYSFGHPDIESVVNRAFPSPSAPNEGERDLNLDVIHTNYRAERIAGFNQQQTELSHILKNKKKEGDARRELVEKNKQQAMGGSIDELGLRELKTLNASLDALKSKVFNKLEVLNRNVPRESGPGMHMGPFRRQ